MDELDMHVKAEALVTAVRHQQRECVRTLLREGCDPCLKHAGRTALYWAVRLDDATMLELLLQDLLLILEAGICLQSSIQRTHSIIGKVDLLHVSDHMQQLQKENYSTEDSSEHCQSKNCLTDDVSPDGDVLEQRDLFPNESIDSNTLLGASQPYKVIDNTRTRFNKNKVYLAGDITRPKQRPPSPNQQKQGIKQAQGASKDLSILRLPKRSPEEKMRARAQRAINEALFEAASHGSSKCIAILLEAHAEPNAYFYHDDEFLSWSTPLLAACFAPVYCRDNFPGESRYVDVIELLVHHGADIGKTNCYGDSALHWAAASGMCEVVQLLLRNGADLNLKNTLGRTPLVCSLEHNGMACDQVCRLLLKWGSKLDIQDNDQWTALHYAVDNKNMAAAELLLSHGAPVDTCIDISLVPSAVRVLAKITPLDIAITSEHVPLVRLLVRYNANVNLRSAFNSFFKSAVELAFETQNIDILEVLSLAGAWSTSMWQGLNRMAMATSSDAPSVQRLQELIGTPHTLRHLARQRIRRVVKDIRLFERLPLPRALIDYLCFCDL